MANNIVERRQIADYLNVGTTTTPVYGLMGTGYTAINESPQAQTTAKRYVNDAAQTTLISSYQPLYAFEADYIKDDTTIAYIEAVARGRKTGEDAITDYVRVYLDEPVTGEDNTYAARKETVSIEVASIPDNEGLLGLSGNLNVMGDGVIGTFDTSSKAFTAA
jgi:hypothetical protein